MEPFLDLFIKPIDDFKNHLSNVENDRILFSGVYGIGKTTFIKHFFKEETQSEILGGVKFKTIYLTPVNYSISSSEDVFSYIKSDIIFELLEKPDLKIDEDYSVKDTLPYYLMNNFDAILSLIQTTLPKIEKKSIVISEKIQKIFENYQEFHKGITNVNHRMIGEFNMSLIQKEGSIYEFNPISEIITQLVTNYKSQNNAKTILIIDDLDRIDPAHIFRIFNVFASHFDYQAKNDNKFGFDKIMFVCDIDNIRNIYHNVYGSNVDFNGYIDKFYSNNIFHFDIKNSLSEMIGNVLRSINYSDVPQENNYLKGKMVESHQLVNTIKELIIQRKLNLRSLFKYYDKSLTFLYDDIDFPTLNKHKISEFPGIFEAKLLAELYGDTDSLIRSLDFCRKNVKRPSILEKQDLLSKIIYLLDTHQNQLIPDEQKELTYEDPDTQIKCHYVLDTLEPYSYVAKINKSIEFPTGFNNNKNHFKNLLYFQMLLIKQLKVIGYLK